MKLYLDNIIYSILKSGGISVVWKEMLSRIIIDNNIDYKCLEFNNSKENIFRKELNIPESKIINKKYLFFKLQRYLNPIVNESEKIIFHSSYYRTCSNPHAVNITTVHDFTYEYYSKGIRKYIHCWQKHKAIRNSQYIICISNNTKKDLLHFLPDISPDKIRVIYNGVSDDYCVLPNIHEEYLPCEKEKYLVYVGARYWYKNFELSIELARQTKLNLVIVGNELTKKETEILNNKLNGRYKFLGRISNKTLNLVYNGAFALIYPSLYEGFGIPIVEAQKAGCPVIAINSSSIPEVIGNVQTLVSRSSIEEATKIVNSLRETNFRNEIINEGINNSKRFTWDKMYTELSQLYNEAYYK